MRDFAVSNQSIISVLKSLVQNISMARSVDVKLERQVYIHQYDFVREYRKIVQPQMQAKLSEDFIRLFI